MSNERTALSGSKSKASGSAGGYLQLQYAEQNANFVFFNAGMPQPKLAAAMLSQGVDIGRAHPPYANWARITIDLPEENQRAQAALRDALEGAAASNTSATE
jgi:histidinol-phosphate/aromatic aminotransferase/cobyric acid decarboxylase-like protein